MKHIIWCTVFCLLLTNFVFLYDIQAEDAANSKTRSTYYTPEKIAICRENIEKYDWAKAIKDSAVKLADIYVDKAEMLWNMITPQTIPRSIIVNLQYSCPNCKEDLRAKFGNYPWIIDPLNEPWKLTCPNCHMKFPTNDFESYYKLGSDSNGIFNPDLAKRRNDELIAKGETGYLVNVLYPEKGPNWGVDDGYGWIDEDGVKHTFIAYYNHWGVWYSGIIQKALDALRDAYIYTGDIKYARAGTILLDRIADVYPDMNLAAYKDSDGYRNSHGGTGQGKIIGSIWETSLVKSFIKAYDAFFPAMNDPEIVNFLMKKAAELNLDNPKNTGALIRKNIEDGILRQVYPAVKNAQIRGNFGMHQSALALAAVVLDSNPETKEWLDFVFKAGGLVSNPWRVTGGDVMATLIDKVDRDGHGNEAAPQYNRIWLTQLLELANILDGYEGYPGADLYKNPKFKKMFSAGYPLILAGKYTAQIGDSGRTGDPGITESLANAVTAFIKYGDPIFAQMAYFLNNNSVEGLRGDIFTKDPESVGPRIQKVIEEYGTLNLKSDNLTGYGFAVLRDGENNEKLDTQRGIWMYYGRNTGHGHKDTLNIGVHAYGLDLAPDLGYPEETGPQPKRMEWVSNTVSHNTVVVDRSKQNDIYVGSPLHFDDSDMVDLIDVDAKEVYPQTDMYRRIVAMIRVNDEISYAVDFFRVKGGNEHHYSFHGYEGTVTTEGLNLVGQKDQNGNFIGTYAGIDTQFGVRPNDDKGSGWDYKGDGFHWLKNVEIDTSPGTKFSIDWDIIDGRKVLPEEMDIHLRLTMLGEYDDVAIMDGEPPKLPGNPKTLKYMIAHRSGENLSSTFLAVIEPYKDTRYIESIDEVAVTVNGKPASEDVKAIKVAMKNGRVDYIVNSLDTETVYTVDNLFEFKGFFGVYSLQDGYPVYAYINDGEKIGQIIENTQSYISGEIVDFTDELSMDNEIVIRIDNLEDGFEIQDLIGRYIYIENDGVQNASYKIKGIKEQDGNQVTLDIGDVTLIRNLVDPNDLSKGYIFNISRGAKFRIPLSVNKELTIQSINKLVNKYVSSGDIVGPLIPQLINSLKQAEHHFKKGDVAQSIKHLENFVKHINNSALQENISNRAREILCKDVNKLINIFYEHN